MKKLIIAIVLFLFAYPVFAWERPLPKDPNRYLIKSPPVQTYPVNPFELQNQQRKQERQLQEIIENQHKLMESQERMQRQQEYDQQRRERKQRQRDFWRSW